MLHYSEFPSHAVTLYERSRIKGQITYWQDTLKVLQSRPDLDSEWRATKTRNANAMLQHWRSKLAHSVRASQMAH